MIPGTWLEGLDDIDVYPSLCFENFYVGFGTSFYGSGDAAMSNLRLVQVVPVEAQ